MAKTHKHCWHDDGAWWNGLGTDGEAHRKCCHCGERQSCRVVSQHDARHGSHVDIRKTYFDGAWHAREGAR